MKRLLVLLFVLIPALLLVFVNAVYSAPPSEPGALLSFPPFMSIGPFPSYFLEFPVDIPDPALNAALHAKTGVPGSDPIHSSDLSALTGSLDLHGLSIADAEGLQYCTKVNTIDLNENELSDMPDMSNFTSLSCLYLADNNFSSVPSGICAIPHLLQLQLTSNPLTNVGAFFAGLTELDILDLSNCELGSFPAALLGMDIEILFLFNNPIHELPSGISGMTHLTELNVNNTGLSTLPDSLFTMTWLEQLEAGNNDMETLAPNVSGLTGLSLLTLRGNKLESLPDSICGMTNLQQLDVSFNGLYKLPDAIGNNIDIILAQGNRLTAIPQSVINPAAVDEFNISMNRLTSLPPGFAGRTFDGIYLEFNFIDVSPGSPARQLLDANESAYKMFQRQLKPLEITGEAGPEWVQLSWTGGEEGSEDGASWEVTGYVIYQYKDGEMVKLDECDSAVNGFAHVGLTPGTEYSYRVGIDYRITEPALEIDYTNRGYTAFDITTLPAEIRTPLPTVYTTAAASSETSPGSLPAAEQTNAAVPGGESAFPVWAIIIAAVGALGIVGTGVAIVILKAKRR